MPQNGADMAPAMAGIANDERAPAEVIPLFIRWYDPVESTYLATDDAERLSFGAACGRKRNTRNLARLASIKGPGCLL